MLTTMVDASVGEIIEQSICHVCCAAYFMTVVVACMLYV